MFIIDEVFGMSNSVSVKSRNVNSKLLFKQIDEQVRDAHRSLFGARFNLMSIEFEFSQLVQYISMMLEELAESGTIRQYDVLCDHRNNPDIGVSGGAVVVTVKFRQKHCLNWTQLDYTFR